MRYRKKNKKIIIIVLLIATITIFTIGYAYLQRTLVINGNSTVLKNTWDVRFTTITPVKNDGVVITAPTVSDNTNITFAVKLNKPGDEYIFTAVIENRGSLDAMLSGTPVISGLENIPYIETSITYADKTAISNRDLLKAGEKETVRVTVSYKRDITEADLSEITETEVTNTVTLSMNYIQRQGNVGNVVDHKICIKADTLHTETCSRTSDGCYAVGYKTGGSKGTTTVTYGHTDSSKLTNEELTNGQSQGYALTCDVNGDNVYNEATERFYYVSDLYTGTTNNVDQFNNNYAVLIYYKNYGSTGVSYYYENSANENWHGPVTLVNTTGALPERTDWTNTKIGLKSITRNIYTETGTTLITDGNHTIGNPFTYTNKVARLLTTHEIDKALNSTSRDTIGYLDNAEYLMEDTNYAKTSGCSGGNCVYWLEMPRASGSTHVWSVLGGTRRVYYYSASSTLASRLVIEILKSNISLE